MGGVEGLFQELLTLDPRHLFRRGYKITLSSSNSLNTKMSLVIQSLHTLGTGYIMSLGVMYLINPVGVINYMKPKMFRCV